MTKSITIVNDSLHPSEHVQIVVNKTEHIIAKGHVVTLELPDSELVELTACAYSKPVEASPKRDKPALWPQT